MCAHASGAPLRGAGIGRRVPAPPLFPPPGPGVHGGRLVALHLLERLAGRVVALVTGEVLQADHALQLPIVVADHDARGLVLAHRPLGVADVVAEAAAHHLVGHDRVDRLVARAAVGQHAHRQVPVRDGADRLAVPVADRDEPDVLLLHQPGGLAHAGALLAAPRLAHDLFHAHGILLSPRVGTGGLACTAPGMRGRGPARRRSGRGAALPPGACPVWFPCQRSPGRYESTSYPR